MIVKEITVQSYLFGSLCSEDIEGYEHRKSEPMLSIVQAVEGSYDISLDGAAVQSTGEGGSFIAPAGAHQAITHHVHPGTRMRARWLFIDVLIDRGYRPESLFSFPTILPHEHDRTVGRLLHMLEQTQGAPPGRAPAQLCRELSAVYRLLDILFSVGAEKERPNERAEQLRRYIERKYARPIDAKDLAAQAGMSVSGLYRLFAKELGLSPANYVNRVRLENACVLLSHSDLRIGEVAQAVGFADVFYFSRLFTRQYGASPSAFRARERLHRDGG